MLIAGVDEAGRGALAGPVVAAAVIFSKDQDASLYRDSKKLTPNQRESIIDHILQNSLAVGIGCVDHKFIDRFNVLQATFLAMYRAYLKLSFQVDKILVDGNRRNPLFAIEQETIIKGDDKIPEISAASIVAKVVRDRIMRGYAKVYPEYLFEQNKGYGTELHMKRIDEFGYCSIHRRSFNISKQLELDKG